VARTADAENAWIVPEWMVKLGRRLLTLEPGRYRIILTLGKRQLEREADWTVEPVGKVERPK
jgi:hypothetical protein